MMTFSSILVSVTEVCTVGCRHCGFHGSTRDREPSPDELKLWITQICDYGIPRIICTGGEPFQRFSLLRAAVQAAASHPARPEVSTFTSSIWGSSPEQVDHHLLQLRGLTHLYLSTDIFHQEKVPIQNVYNVIEGAVRHGIPKISICITIAEDWEEQHTKGLFKDYADKVMFHVDRVIPTPFLVGIKADGAAPDPAKYKSTCYLDTPLLNPNGDVSACHIGKAGAYVDLQEQVYFLGNLNSASFQEIMRKAEPNYEYQFLRCFGPQGIARMIQQSPTLTRTFGGTGFTNGCDLCYKVLRSTEGRNGLRELVNEPEWQKVIDAARMVRFGEVSLEEPLHV